LKIVATYAILEAMKKQILIVIGVLVVVLAMAIFFGKKESAPSQYDSFATCIKDSGASFYGAFWCQHCREQKAMFGRSAKLLPYIECSTPDGQSQTAICKEKGISSYPTWIFANGEKGNGTLQLANLASSTSCALPEATS